MASGTGGSIFNDEHDGRRRRQGLGSKNSRGWSFATIPSTASNQFEMWQADTFDAETIGRELKWAAEIGMNSVRVFSMTSFGKLMLLGFKSRIETFCSWLMPLAFALCSCCSTTVGSLQ